MLCLLFKVSHSSLIVLSCNEFSMSVFFFFFFLTDYLIQMPNMTYRKGKQLRKAVPQKKLKSSFSWFGGNHSEISLKISVITEFCRRQNCWSKWVGKDEYPASKIQLFRYLRYLLYIHMALSEQREMLWE